MKLVINVTYSDERNCFLCALMHSCINLVSHQYVFLKFDTSCICKRGMGVRPCRF